jgi:DNA-3-methyladenine glycosylase II
MSTKSKTPPAPANPHAKAMRHLSRKCPVMKQVVARVGPCTWAPISDDPFTVLVRCVIFQQISTKAARSILDRLLAAVGGMPIARDRLLALTEADFKACGVSGPKQRTLRAVVDHIATNPDLLPGIADRDETLIRTQLTAIKGIGPWSADMFLMFGNSRNDIFPVGDLGLRMGVMKAYGFAEMPTAAELEEVGEKWKPYRSIGTWYIWRVLELMGQEQRADKKV